MAINQETPTQKQRKRISNIVTKSDLKKLHLMPVIMEVLQWYGDRGNYKIIRSFNQFTRVGVDKGKKAREVLNALYDTGRY